jgi:hypothetical protein
VYADINIVLVRLFFPAAFAIALMVVLGIGGQPAVARRQAGRAGRARRIGRPRLPEPAC